jgi:hypothetical protein
MIGSRVVPIGKSAQTQFARAGCSSGVITQLDDHDITNKKWYRVQVSESYWNNYYFEEGEYQIALKKEIEWE